VSGEVDPSNVAALAHALESAFTDRGLLVDMSEVEFIDVAGLRKMHQVSSRAGGELVLLSPKPVVRKSIELLGIGAPVTIDEAV
jgi:anti-anti-sigma factor